MTEREITRIHREATSAEATRHKQIREQIQQELPDIRHRARQLLTEFVQHGSDVQQLLAALKSERLQKGISLAELGKRTGIDVATLLALEENIDADPTVGALTQYADAVGKKVLVVLTDAND